MTRHRGKMKYLNEKEININSFQKPKSRFTYKSGIIMAGIFITLVASIIIFYQMPTSVARTSELASDWHQHKFRWSPRKLSPLEMANVCNRWNEERFWKNLDPILIPRTPGSRNIKKVADHFYNLLRDKFIFEVDRFFDKAPSHVENTEFTNLIATYNPGATRKLVLACHYDSKVTPEGFIGATDSAAPCAMMIEIAMALEPYLSELKRQQENPFGPVVHDVTLQLLFLDGEEAFIEWRDNDNTYGARHLANKWNLTSYTEHQDRNVLDGIDLFVLLDLIGAISTQFKNNRPTKTQWYLHAADIEQRLRTAGLIDRNNNPYFPTRELNYYIEDDHIPFMREGVPILHLISIPFPKVWHKLSDNKSALDTPTMEKITKILMVFVSEYLRLTPST